MSRHCNSHGTDVAPFAHSCDGAGVLVSQRPSIGVSGRAAQHRHVATSELFVQPAAWRHASSAFTVALHMTGASPSLQWGEVAGADVDVVALVLTGASHTRNVLHGCSPLTQPDTSQHR